MLFDYKHIFSSMYSKMEGKFHLCVYILSIQVFLCYEALISVNIINVSCQWVLEKEKRIPLFCQMSMEFS